MPKRQKQDHCFVEDFGAHELTLSSYALKSQRGTHRDHNSRVSGLLIFVEPQKVRNQMTKNPLEAVRIWFSTNAMKKPSMSARSFPLS